MNNVKNTAVLVAVSNSSTTEGGIPLTIATLINENASFELPHCNIVGNNDMKTQLLETFHSIVDIDNVPSISSEDFKLVGTYSVENETGYEIINAFMFIIDGKPSVRKNSGDKTLVWMNIDAFEHQNLHGNHNNIIADVRKALLETALDPLSNVSIGEGTRTAIIQKYFPSDSKTRHSWISRLQGSGLHVHEYLHPGVAVDLVIFGYRKTQTGNHDELSVLLTYRKNDDSLGENIDDPWAGTWSLPGTFLLDKNSNSPYKYPDLETVKEAAIRVAKEKTGLEIDPNDVFYDIKPFVHTSRMGGIMRDGSPVITLPVFIPVEYTKVNENTSSLTTKGCRWFPVKRELWTVNETEGGPKPVALRGGENGPLRIKEDGKYEEVTDVMDDNSRIETWNPDDVCNLQSPEEIGLPAADVYIQNEKLVIKYYQNLIRPYRPIQDKFYDNNISLPEGAEFMTADHANIIIAALQTISDSVSKTLHIVSKLLKGGTFKPIKIIRMLGTWWFPWSFSRSNMHKKLVASGLIIPIADDKAPESKIRNANYMFVDESKIDNILRDIKPL